METINQPTARNRGKNNSTTTPRVDGETARIGKARFAARAGLSLGLLLLAAVVSCKKENNISENTNNNYAQGIVCVGPETNNPQCLAAAGAPAGAVCVYGYCRSECTTDAKCNAIIPGSICLPGSGKSGCSLQQEDSCGQYKCGSGLVCASDAKCRVDCAAKPNACSLAGLSCENGACVGTATGGKDAGADGSVDASTDTGSDVGVDSQSDASADSAADAAADSAVDASVDSAADALADSAVDASVDSAADASADSAVDASVDSAAEAGSMTYGIVGQSCAGGLSCISSSCCDSIAVPGGTFPMGRSTSGTDKSDLGDTSEVPEHSATVNEFYLDRFEVTVGRFRRFVQVYDGTPPAAGAGDHDSIGAGWQSDWNTSMPGSQGALISSLKCEAKDVTWTDLPGANENRAINCVDWYVAMAFCLWDGGRLPTEAEWEYAAAGGSDNTLYPWGATDPSSEGKTFANDLDSGGSAFIDVGSHPKGKGRWEHQDLAGGMWEWTMDWFDKGWYGAGGATCNNCSNVAKSAASNRVFRGGGWNDQPYNERAAARNSNIPTFRGTNVGFRCSRTK